MNRAELRSIIATYAGGFASTMAVSYVLFGTSQLVGTGLGYVGTLALLILTGVAP